MRSRGWCVSLMIASLGVACGDQPTEVVPEGEMTRAPGVMAAATSTSEDGRSITTDKDDYAPGDTVWFTGAGWTPGDVLDIVLTDEPTNHRHEWIIEVSEGGTFRDSTYVVDVEDLGVTFTLTATSRSNPEQTLRVMFTDGNVQVKTSGPTVSVSFVKRAGGGATCTSGNASTDGSPQNVGTSYAALSGVNAGQFILITVPASSGGQNFSGWTVDAGSSPASGYTLTSNPICFPGSESNQRFTVNYAAAANAAPNAPASPAQFKSNGTTSIPTGGATEETTVVLKGALSDPNAGNTIKLQVEVRAVGTAFSNTSTSESALVSNGSTASVTVSGLANTSNYHWQARAVDNSGAASAWVSFGGNAEADTDFRVLTDRPTVTINQAAGQADPTNTSPINFTVVFSEPVTGFATGDVTLDGTAGATTATVTGSGATYNVAVSGMNGDGTVIAAIAAGVASDAAGNTNLASTSTDKTVTYDAARPTVTINQAAGQADPTSASPINFTVVFSEIVTGFESGDVSLSGTANTSTPVVTGSGTTYNVAVPVTSRGTVIASIGADKATDAAGNDNTASTSVDHTVTFDPEPPAVSNVAVSPNPTNGTINVTASATVDDAATGSSKIVSAYYRIDNGSEIAMNASDGGFDEATENVTASIPAATVAALAEGPHTVCVRGTDQAGNSSSYDDIGACATLTVDKTPPEVAINQKVGQADPTNTSPINFTVAFTEDVSDFTTGDVTLGGTAGATTATVTGSGRTYNVAVSGMTGDGTVIASIASGVAHDAAGNANNASTSTDKTVVYDGTAPVISCGAADSDWHAANVSIACTASDATSGLANAADASFSLSTTVAAGQETANALTESRSVLDKAGNSATAGPVGANKIDRKAPAVALTCPANPVLLNDPAAVANWTATDGGSGVTPNGTVSLVTSSIGSKTASATVQDNVGNSTNAQCNYNVAYNFAGFYAPVDRPNTLNVSKAGQAIPLKWRLTDALGRPITDLTGVTVKAVGMNCDGSAAADPIEEYATASTSGLLNLGDGNYQYNWKTATAFAGTCKSISLVFGSGALSYIEGPRAFFSFKK